MVLERLLASGACCIYDSTERQGEATDRQWDHRMMERPTEQLVESLVGHLSILMTFSLGPSGGRLDAGGRKERADVLSIADDRRRGGPGLQEPERLHHVAFPIKGARAPDWPHMPSVYRICAACQGKTHHPVDGAR